MEGVKAGWGHMVVWCHRFAQESILGLRMMWESKGWWGHAERGVGSRVATSGGCSIREETGEQLREFVSRVRVKCAQCWECAQFENSG